MLTLRPYTLILFAPLFYRPPLSPSPCPLPRLPYPFVQPHQPDQPQGINFNVPPQEEYRWNTYLRTDPIDYGPEHPPHLVDFVDPVICPLVSGNPAAASC